MLAVMLAVAGASCAGADDAGSTTAASVPTSSPSTTVAPATSDSPPSSSGTTTIAPPTSTSQTSTTPTVPVEQPTVLVYFLRDEVLTVGGRTVAAATPAAAMTALLDGPTADEKAAGAVSVVPGGTRLLGLEVDGGEAVVDLSAPFAEGGGSLSLVARVTQVVFTVTQFPEIDTVRFRIDGEPVVDLGGEGLYVDGLTRDTYDWLVPYVLLERPVPASSASRPLRLLGRVGGPGPELVVEVRDPAGGVVYTTSVPNPAPEAAWGVLDVVLTDLPSTISGPHVIRVLDPLADPGDSRSRPAEVVVTL